MHLRWLCALVARALELQRSSLENAHRSGCSLRNFSVRPVGSSLRGLEPLKRNTADDAALRASPLGSNKTLSAERKLRPLSGDGEGFPVEGVRYCRALFSFPGSAERSFRCL
jgi:hypothetical protein